MRANYTIDNANPNMKTASISLSQWEADSVMVVNPTMQSVYVTVGSNTPSTEPTNNNIYVPPLSTMSQPVTGSNFAATFGNPSYDSSQNALTQAQVILTKGEIVPAYGSMPVTNLTATVEGNINANITNASINTNATIQNQTLNVAGSVNATIQNASIPVSGSVNANITNASLPISGTINANITNASIPITTSGNIDVEVQNATLETNAGILAGNDLITGSPFSIGAGTTGGTGTITMSTWGGLSLLITSPDSLGSHVFTQAEIDVSNDGTTWYVINSYGISGQGTITAVVPRLAAYLRVNIPVAGTANVVIMVRFVRTEVVQFEESVNANVLTFSNQGVLVGAASWFFVSLGAFPPSNEVLFFTLAASGGVTQNTDIGIGFGTGGPNPNIIVAWYEFTTTMSSLQLGPYLPGKGIPLYGNNSLYLYNSIQTSFNLAMWYR